MARREHGAFIHARYSTDNQNPDSIDVQVSKCREWCQENNVPVLGIFPDEAVSGMKDTRPKYEEMMHQLRLGWADTVVIYDQSRMFRKMTAWFDFRDELTKMGVEVVCVTQPMIGKDLRDPTNFLTEGSMALFNQIWALQSRQKTIEKMRYMAMNKQHTGGKPPLGYMTVDGKLEICEDEAAIVRRIFHEYAGGMTYKQIINGLNADGIKTKNGNTFGNNSLHDLLKNEKYIGTLVYGKVQRQPDGSRNSHGQNADDVIKIDNAIPAIIDKEIFYKVQKKMEQNKRQPSGRPASTRNYPLKGKVFCGHCKAPLSVSISKMSYYYYICSEKKRKHNCQGVNISISELEDAVVDAVKKVLGTPKNVNNLIRILREQQDALHGSAAGRLQALIRESEECTRKLDNAVEAVLNGLASAAIKNKIKELEARKEELEAEMYALKHKVDASAIPEDQLMQILNKIILGETTKAKEAILSIVYRVEVTDEEITVWTILDADPSGHYDFDDEGVLITPGVRSPAPNKKERLKPLFFIW